MDICGIQKDSTSEPISKAETEIQVQRTKVQTPKEERGVEHESADWS